MPVQAVEQEAESGIGIYTSNIPFPLLACWQIAIMPSYTDQTGNTIQLDHIPKRIVSLVPSQTELLYTLGLEEEVVGITKFCVHPQEWFRSKKRIGGTKNIHLNQVLDLRPDLIIAGKEENVAEQVLSLSREVPVWTSDVANLYDALQMIRNIGMITGKTTAAESLCPTISAGFDRLQQLTPPTAAVYLIWKDPYMTVGGDTFIHDMMARCGISNLFAGSKRYPQTSLAAIRNMGCRLLLLSSEPYPFSDKDINEIRSFLPETRIELVDGEYFSWYGSRLQLAPKYFANLVDRLQQDF